MRRSLLCALLLASSAGSRAASAPPAVEPESLTASPAANDQLLYFTSTSLLADDRHLVFLSDRTGQPNIFLRDLATGRDRQLTTNTEGFLKSYVYFDGQPYRGFGRASVSVDPEHGVVYYLQGRQIRAVDTNGATRVLAEYPAGQMTAFTHVSADGTRLCVPTTDARALDGDTPLKGKPDYNIDARVQQENLASYLRVYDTATGKELLCERVPKAWITHVQFSPRDRSLILYNHEWPADCGIRRMWLWDGKSHLRLRTEGDGRSRADWTCHEMWERDGSAIIYHGGYAKGASYLGRVNPDGTGRVEIALPAEWKRYGHFTVGRPGWLVTDGCYEQPGDPPGNGAWISVLHVDWAAKRYDWQPLCRNGSSWKSQDAHPHPIFNHAADAVCFTSDKTGKRAVYRVEAPVGPATAAAVPAAGPGKINFSAIPSPILFRGDATTAYRDPTAVYHDGWFRLFFTVVKVEAAGPVSCTAWSKSRDLVRWTEPVLFTPRDRKLNYCSPGNIVRDGGEWVLCLCTYPRPNGEKFGNADARIWTMRSKDLETWGPAELLRVKGPDVPQEKMGRMIDPFLLQDKDEAGKWWCFYKQAGVSMSWSCDLKTWTYAGRTSAGENTCVIVDGADYVLFHSPGNGVGVKRSADLQKWRDEGLLTLGQKEWPWAQGRLTAGFVLDLRQDPAVGKALMFFHGSDHPENDPRGGFDNFASLGLAWSDDLKNWTWPGGVANGGGGK